MTDEEFKKLWGETQRYCTFQTGPAWLHFAKLVEQATAKRCVDQLQDEIAQLKREKEEAEQAAAHVYNSLNEALRQRDATIKAAVQFIRTHTAENLREGLLAILDKEQSCSTTGEVK